MPTKHWPRHFRTHVCILLRTTFRGNGQNMELYDKEALCAGLTHVIFISRFSLQLIFSFSLVYIWKRFWQDLVAVHLIFSTSLNVSSHGCPGISAGVTKVHRSLQHLWSTTAISQHNFGGKATYS